MQQIRFRLGLCPIPRWRSFQRSRNPLAGFGSRFAAGGIAWLRKKRERGWEGDGEEVEGGKGRTFELLLNNGPSQHCYATAFNNAKLQCNSVTDNSKSNTICTCQNTNISRQYSDITEQLVKLAQIVHYSRNTR